ncbi:MAG: alanine racemase [Xenococcaceae cyanobacterium MO_207.B15]|nr:alanine racemase [Xenococcaceae cyanobacterium MO_207.B15]
MISWQKQTKTVSSCCDNLTHCQRAWIEIDLNKLAYNIRQIKSILSPHTELMAVVKADAYGHGAVEIAQTALKHGASWLAVATLSEGIQLRQAEIEAPILILGAINSPEEIKAVAYWQLEPTIGNSQQALNFSDILTTLKTSLPVHLKLDTGMSRLGTNWENALEFVKFVQKLPQLQLASIYSHLATADESDRTFMNLQHQRFQQAIEQLKQRGITPPRKHIANSAATLCDRSLHYDLVRVGLAIYGLYPSAHLSETIPLQPILQVKARITQVKTIKAGTGVSYGHKFIADRDTKIAIVGIGYADGVPRNLSNRLKVIVRDELVSQIGAITMDQLILDVSQFSNIQPGEIVTLIGSCDRYTISADDWSKTLNTISWEILCGFKHRLPRVYLQ